MSWNTNRRLPPDTNSRLFEIPLMVHQALSIITSIILDSPDWKRKKKLCRNCQTVIDSSSGAEYRVHIQHRFSVGPNLGWPIQKKINFLTFYPENMAEIVLTKQKIEDGKTQRLKEWMDEICEREEEAIETLKNEGMHSETAFIEHTDEGDFLLYYMKANDIEQVFESFENSSHEIDKEHKQVMNDVLESGENVSDYEVLYHLDNPELP